MASPQHDVTDRLDVTVAPGGKVIAISDLHLPPERTTVSGRSCEVLSRSLAAETGPITVVLVGDIVEMLAYPGRAAADVLDAHDDLCRALAMVTERGGQVIYTVGNHDGDLAWDLKAATAVREATGAKLCLAADLVLPGGEKIRVEHGHQIDPYNCFHDPRNPPRHAPWAPHRPRGHPEDRVARPGLAHRRARDGGPGGLPVVPRLPARLPEACPPPVVGDPGADRAVRPGAPQVGRVRNRYPDAGRWLHDGEILGYGALVDIAIIALIIAIVSRRAWTSISALALSERGYGQNSAARERADELIGQGYTGYLSGHTHHPELHAHGDGFYGNTGSCTSVVEAIDTIYGMPPVYLRTQQLSWLEISAGPAAAGEGQDQDQDSERVCVTRPCHAQLKLARVELPGATRFERFLASARNPHPSAPKAISAWPQGPDWPSEHRHLKHRHLKKAKKAVKRATHCERPS